MGPVRSEMHQTHPDKERMFWESVWRKQEDRDFWTQVDPEVAKLAEAVTPEQYPAVLDLGCGLGRNAIPFSRAGHSVTTVDVSETAVAYVRAQAEELGLQISTKVARFTEDIFADEQFDLVLAVNVLYHGLPSDFPYVPY